MGRASRGRDAAAPSTSAAARPVAGDDGSPRHRRGGHRHIERDVRGGAGIETVVIDRAAPNSQASGGNAGSLHVQLLSGTSAARPWRRQPALRTIPLQRDAVQLWKELERDLGGDFEITTTGGLMVAEKTRNRLPSCGDKAAKPSAAWAFRSRSSRAPRSPRSPPHIAREHGRRAYCRRGQDPIR